MQQYPPGSTQPTPVVHPDQRQTAPYPPQTPVPPVQPPRKRMARGKKIGIVFIAMLLAAVVLLVVIIEVQPTTSQPSTAAINATVDASNALTATGLANQNATAIAASEASLSNDLTQTAMTPTAQPTTPVDTTGVGATQSSGVWNITVNSIKIVVSDNQFEVPKAGDEFIDINVTTVNTDTNAQQMNPLYFTLRDDSGTQYNWTGLTIAHSIFGTVVSGQKIRGDLTYEVPKSDHAFMLQFDMPGDFTNSQVVQWNLTI